MFVTKLWTLAMRRSGIPSAIAFVSSSVIINAIPVSFPAPDGHLIATCSKHASGI